MAQGHTTSNAAQLARHNLEALGELFADLPMAPTQFERLLSCFHDAVIITEALLEPTGPRVRWVNAAFTELTGFRIEDFASDSTPALFRCWRADDPEGWELRKKMRAGESYEGERVQMRKDGVEFTGRWWVQPLLGKDGETAFFVMVLQDKSMERRDEMRYRSIFENALEGIFQSTPSGGYIDLNPALARMYGYESKEELMASLTLIGQQLYVKPERRLEFMQLMQEHGEVAKFESQVYRRDGSVIWISEYARAVRDDAGEVLYYEGTVEEITDRKRSEARIQQQAALLNKTRDAIMVLDLTGAVRFWNSGATRIYGWHEHEMLGGKATRIFTDSGHEKLFEARTKAAAKGEWTGELPQVQRGGREVIVESRWTLMRDELGVPESFLVINTDITERTKLEKQFLQSQRMESLGMLAGGIAHDLNNVLAPILMATNYLLEKLPDSQSRSMMAMAQESAERGADLVRQVLSFARGSEPGKGRVDAKAMTQGVYQMARTTFPKTIQISMEVAADLWPLEGDATQLHQVLLNLCVNARDALLNKRAAQISITVENISLCQPRPFGEFQLPAGNYVRLSVRDNGHGIPAELQAHIFEPFFTTKSHDKGTGLGLSTVMVIVRGHGGALELESVLGEGTAFHVFLPAAVAEAVGMSFPAEPTVLRSVTHGRRVLVVDDELAILQITREVLERYGYGVVSANSGTAALKLMEEKSDRFDLALVDMMMPGMNGRQTIEALRQHQPELKVVAVSGIGGEEASQALSGQAVFLAKPYTFNDLLNTLEDVIASS